MVDWIIRLLIIGAVVAGIYIWYRVNNPAPEPVVDDRARGRIGDLEDEVEGLRSRLRDLEGRIEDLDGRIDVLEVLEEGRDGYLED